MVKLDNVTEEVLSVINDNKFSQSGAFNLRQNGTSICHGDSDRDSGTCQRYFCRHTESREILRLSADREPHSGK